MRLGRIIIIAGLLLALAACKHENPVYVTVNEEFDVVIDNTTESVKMVIEGGFNPHIRQVVSNADWLQVRYSGTIKLDEFKDPDTGFYWLSGGEYPQFELSYTTYDYLDEYDERDTDVIITTESGNTLTLHVTQGDRSLESDEEKPNYCFVPTGQGVFLVLNTGGGMGGPRLSDIKSVNTDFEADWTQEEAIYLFDGKGPEAVNNIKGYTIVPLPWADINESHLPDGEAKKMLKDGQWKLVLNYTGNRSLPNFNYFAMYNPYVGKLRFFYYLAGDANMKDINDHLWAITIPSEWAAALERPYALAYDFTDHGKLSNYRNSRFTYLTTPYTDDGRFGTTGNIIPESGWWAIDIDMPAMAQFDRTAIGKKEISLRMLAFNKDHVSLQSLVKADIDGSFKGNLNLDALWKKPRSVSSLGTILSTATGLVSDLAADDNFSNYFLDAAKDLNSANPYALGLAVASIGFKAISGVITGLDKEEEPDISKTGQMEGALKLDLRGTIDTEGFIRGDRQSGLKFPSFTVDKLAKDAGIGEGLWNLETAPVAYYTAASLTFANEEDRQHYLGRNDASTGAVDYFFDPSSVRVKLNENLFPASQIQSMSIRMTPEIPVKEVKASWPSREAMGIPVKAPRVDWKARTRTINRLEEDGYPGMPLPAYQIPIISQLGYVNNTLMFYTKTEEEDPFNPDMNIGGLGVSKRFLSWPFWVDYSWPTDKEMYLPELSVIINLYIQLKDGTRCTYTRTYPVRFQYVESFDEYNNLLRGAVDRLGKVPYAKFLHQNDQTAEKMVQREIGLRYYWEY